MATWVSFALETELQFKRNTQVPETVGEVRVEDRGDLFVHSLAAIGFELQK